MDDPSALCLSVGTQGKQAPEMMQAEKQSAQANPGFFMSFLDAPGSNAGVGSPSWGFCPLGSPNAAATPREAVQLPSKRFQEAMLVHPSANPVTGHGKKVSFGSLVSIRCLSVSSEPKFEFLPGIMLTSSWVAD